MSAFVCQLYANMTLSNKIPNVKDESRNSLEIIGGNSVYMISIYTGFSSLTIFGVEINIDL